MPTSDRKVLIIEDNEDLQVIYRFAFEDAGFEVKISGNGLAGITDIVDFQPTVVVLDVMMPEMSGYEFLTALRHNTSMHVPVVVVSNLAQEQDKQRALAAGADHYLIKADYDGPELVAAVTRFLSESAAASQAPASQPA